MNSNRYSNYLAGEEGQEESEHSGSEGSGDDAGNNKEEGQPGQPGAAGGKKDKKKGKKSGAATKRKKPATSATTKALDEAKRARVELALRRQEEKKQAREKKIMKPLWVPEDCYNYVGPNANNPYSHGYLCLNCVEGTIVYASTGGLKKSRHNLKVHLEVS